MNIGTICYSTTQGIGLLAKRFYDNGIVTHPLVFEHRSRPNNYAWYPIGTPVLRQRPFPKTIIEQWLSLIDALLLFETPFDWSVITAAKRRGKKAALVTMYECTPEHIPVEPDIYLCPSKLDLDYFPSNKSMYLPIPVEIPWRLREKADVFVHNAGHGGLKGRNGTKELLEALQFVDSPIRLIVRSQKPIDAPKDDRLEIQIGTVDFNQLWNKGDVFVFPETFNGLSLPLQEAYASGMLVMATRRYPMTDWLPNEPLIDVDGYVTDRIGGCFPFKRAIVSPQKIAKKIDEWYGRDISDCSESGRQWAVTMSWSVLGPKYLEALR